VERRSSPRGERKRRQARRRRDSRRQKEERRARRRSSRRPRRPVLGSPVARMTTGMKRMSWKSIS